MKKKSSKSGIDTSVDKRKLRTFKKSLEGSQDDARFGIFNYTLKLIFDQLNKILEAIEDLKKK